MRELFFIDQTLVFNPEYREVTRGHRPPALARLCDLKRRLSSTKRQ
ncbi:hypothetical protein ALP23_101963 [Pseudomonas syringae pv. apii]|uniref:Uncharacterized protein n=2 Tax=Pseudomonas syringae group TaxID=136849 RepID=A0A3M5WJJ8_9PSED|nr:Unknown protein sequence [Pseudomonas syringae pv. aceris]KPW06506.1 hypothetical protein ALO91_102617 [Pseudomonas syringae pv. aceris]RMU70669.1 hypothetical protein ALP23_101963 [Pseudomonas syringae pv. apii]